MNLLANPVLQQEMRRRMRGNRAMVILTVYLLLISIITLLIFLLYANVSFLEPNIQHGRELGKAIFYTVTIAALIQVYIITPSLTAGSIASEKEHQTYDLLITTLLSPWDIVLGKMVASLAYATLLVLSVLPIAGIAFMFGGVSGAELAIAMVILLTTVVLCAAIGMFWSVVATSTLQATVRSQSTTVLLLILIPFLTVIFTSIIDTNNWELAEDLANTPFFVYASGAFFCFHPFITFALTEVALSEGENIFFFTIDPGRGDILIPAPWLAYTFMVIMVSSILLLVSVRMLKPVQYTMKRKKK